MSIQDYNIGQAIDYRTGTRWQHGHICKIDDNDYCPMVTVDSTIYDYRPHVEVVAPESIRPAATECTSGAVCQEVAPSA